MRPSFLCLRCSAPMQRFVRKRVEVDECAKCKGLWLDSSELASLIGSWSDLPRTVEPPSLPGPESLHCPHCRCALLRRAYSDQKRTILDHCPQCQGIWLDRGELDRILYEVYGISEY